jgi:hypothetical protein
MKKMYWMINMMIKKQISVLLQIDVKNKHCPCLLNKIILNWLESSSCRSESSNILLGCFWVNQKAALLREILHKLRKPLDWWLQPPTDSANIVRYKCCREKFLDLSVAIKNCFSKKNCQISVIKICQISVPVCMLWREKLCVLLKLSEWQNGENRARIH